MARRRPPSGAAGRARPAALLLLLFLAALAGAAAADPFDAAPLCPSWPRASAAVADTSGRLWGYLEGEGLSCAHRDAQSGQPLQLNQWEAAPPCDGGGPSPSGSSRDGHGRLWGWSQERGASCAHKDAASGRPLLYGGYEPGDWLETPACPGADDSPASAAFDELSVADAQLKTWTWGAYTDGPRLCAFKDDRQAPVPPDPRDYVRLSFADGPPCGGSEASPSERPSPDNARPDRDGFLWGWALARPCAWKSVKRDEATGRIEFTAPIYHEGYEGPRAAGREPLTGAGEPPTGAGSPAPSSSSSSPSPGGSQVEVPPVDSEFRYRRSGEGAPAPSPRQ